MNDIQSEKELLKKKDIRIAYLEKICQKNLFSLDLIASMGDMHGSNFFNKDIKSIFSLTQQHLNRFIDFDTVAFFNINEFDSSFELESCDPPAEQGKIQERVDQLIEDGAFAWALNQNRPVVVKKSRSGNQLILHVLSTKLRVRGMFVGALKDDKQALSDNHLYPLSIALHYTANALESAALYKIISDHNQNLQETVKKRTIDLKNQTEKLKQEINERKQAEKELNKYKNHLEKLVEKRTAELKSAYDQLLHAEKLSAVGKLSASIAHEFSNPIAGIKTVLERVSQKVSMDKTNKELVDIARNECARVEDLVERLRDFYRPSPGVIAPMDIHKIIDEVLSLSRAKLMSRGIKIKKNYASDVHKIIAISDQIKQVILNLINNAEEAISIESGKISVSTNLERSKIKIAIEDSGCGISPENVKSIFDPFFTTKGDSKGTGLGLSISYGIIKRHGGEIEVKSKSGAGATFTIILPLEGAYSNKQ